MVSPPASIEHLLPCLTLTLGGCVERGSVLLFSPGQEWKEAEAAKQRLEDERRKEEAARETHLRGSE